MKNLIYDVVVVGGGPSGTVAAIAAARHGAKTLLVEQSGFLGGALTRYGTGPQMTYHAGKTQVVRGIPDEIVERMKALGYSPGHMDDFVGYASSVTPFDTEGLKYVLEQMALEAGVTLLYHTLYTGCHVQDKKITCITLHAKNGAFSVEAKVVIDCTGDADVATHAGVPSVFGRESDNLAQPMTMNVKVSGVDRDKLIDFVSAHRDDMLPTIPFDRLREIPRTGIQGAYSLVKRAKERGEFSVDRDMVLCFETNNVGEFIVNMSRITKKMATDPFELTEAEVEGRRQGREIVAFLQKYIPGFESCKVVMTGPYVGIRESRKINGVYKLTAEDLLENTMFNDAIAMGGYPIDIHSPDGAATKHRFLSPGSWYSVPYRCLVSHEIDNLIVSGRCISATHEACAAVRVTPVVMAISQGAGTAAALCAEAGVSVQDVDITELKKQLAQDGAFLDEYKGTLFA
ncbi:FAD-dependent oxidoreductase [Parasphaerochaeta coccoides]|uniref:Glucose-inhibited division protein A n=1 Tax=Parasphaerochaeta coccoides (strain ATCC BAA-1237 / DSM 17374 / SPN1) TaxID=760011 RepID=F4GLE2_PARC1|nr:FAD-dependent oxidoreductase [Parasphaerochaeta coccoides]AEC02974.1 glucose-inhibited division protein A [Parasphaerochaeta coccoides DSM 17374]